MEVTIAVMTGKGSIRHNNRSFTAANVDKERTHLNVVFCNDDLKTVYHELFDEAVAAYNAGKKKTRDKIPDYYEHIRQGKQEKLFHESIFQIGNLGDCACGTENGDRAAAALTAFAESFQERNPHLRVFNMVLHLDEATPHLHIDFVPVATEQTRGLATRVSLKQALKQQGFVGRSRNETEWKFWMEREKETLKAFAAEQGFEVISLGSTRPHMELTEYKAAVRELESVRQAAEEEERRNTALRAENKALEGSQKLLKRAEKVKLALDEIKPEKAAFGTVKGVTVEDIDKLKAMAVRGAAAEQRVRELESENRRLNAKIPSPLRQLEERQRLDRLNRMNADLAAENEYLRGCLDSERSFTDRLLDAIENMLDYIEEHLPERLKPVIDAAKKLLPTQEKQEEAVENSKHENKKENVEL